MAQVEIKGLREMQSKWQRIATKTKKSIKFGFRSYMIWVVRYMREEKLSGQVLNRQTSTLFRKTKEQMGSRGDSADVVSTPYGVYWEYGIKKHFVAPVDKMALGWGGPKGGPHKFFSKGHWIPEQAARPWAHPSIEETRKERDEQFGDAIRKAFAE